MLLRDARAFVRCCREHPDPGFCWPFVPVRVVVRGNATCGCPFPLDANPFQLGCNVGALDVIHHKGVAVEFDSLVRGLNSHHGVSNSIIWRDRNTTVARFPVTSV